MGRQFWEETVSWATSDGVAVNTSTTETIVMPNVTIPANFMQDGRVLRVTVMGRWSSLTATTPTVTWRIRWGGVAGTLLVTSGAITTTATATTSGPFKMEVLIQTRTNGSSGTLFGFGEIWMQNGAAATLGTATNLTGGMALTSTGTTVPAAVTVDLTADTALSITGQWSASSVSNAFTGHIYTVEALN